MWRRRGIRTAYDDSGTRTTRGASDRIAVLDGLRLVAALSVVSFHYVALGWSPWETSTLRMFPHIYPVTGYGWLGVELFFMISGFVICMSSWGRTLGQFAVSRIVRIYPAFWFAVLLTSAVLAVFPRPQPRHSLGDVLINLSMVQQPLGVASVDPVYWTLWRELMFYLIFSIVVWRGVNYRRVLSFCALWLVATILATGSHSVLLDNIVDPDFSMFFVAGITLYLIRRFGWNLMLCGLLVGAYLLSLHSVLLHAPDRATFVATKPNPWVAGALVTVFFLVLLAVALGLLDRVRGRWLVVAGALTFPLYLLHQSIGWVLIYHLHRRAPRYLVLVGVVLTMLLLAWLVHRLVERPVSRWMKARLTSALVTMRTATGQADPPIREALTPASGHVVPPTSPAPTGPAATHRARHSVAGASTRVGDPDQPGSAVAVGGEIVLARPSNGAGYGVPQTRIADD
jgi:peptidoglycan/LPS O-acetylase OafA/YrhL